MSLLVALGGEQPVPWGWGGGQKAKTVRGQRDLARVVGPHFLRSALGAPGQLNSADFSPFAALGGERPVPWGWGGGQTAKTVRGQRDLARVVGPCFLRSAPGGSGQRRVGNVSPCSTGWRAAGAMGLGRRPKGQNCPGAT